MVEEDPCGLAQEPAAAQTFHQQEGHLQRELPDQALVGDVM